MRYAIIVCVVLVLCPRDRITENLDKGVKRGKVKGVWCVSHSAHYHKTLLTHGIALSPVCSDCFYSQSSATASETKSRRMHSDFILPPATL